MATQVAAFFGELACGKTTASEILVEEYEYTRLAFARMVREVCIDMLNAGRIREEPFTIEEIDANKSVFRPLLQWVGTDLVRQYTNQPNFWVDRLAERVADTDGPVVIDDLRFVNEAQALIDMDAVFARIVTPEYLRYERHLGHRDDLTDDEKYEAWDKANGHDSEQHYGEIAEQLAIAEVGLTQIHNASDEADFIELIHQFVASAVA